MKRIHILVIAVMLAASALAGLSAVLRTTHLRAAAAQPRLSAGDIARRNRRLDAIEKRLLAQANGKPHTAAPDRPVVYVRPKPIVQTVHRTGEHESEGHEGGELDD